jgi:phosphate transport system substrate-binding protein
MPILIVAVMLTLASCSAEAISNGEVGPYDSKDSYNPLNVKGEVVTAGSSTLFPLSERMAERFRQEGFASNITVDSIGSGAGFERFCGSGESDVANASRPIKQSEIENCAQLGRSPIEFRVGTDALVVVVSQENDFLVDLSLEEIASIFSTAESWADVRSDWPSELIQRFIPGTDSGTFDYFVEEVFDKDEEPILLADNLQLSEDDNVLAQGILGSPYSIGFFGFAYYAENQDSLKVISIDAVEPSQKNVDSATYPLARPLYIYSDAEIMGRKPSVAAFILFYLERVNDEVVDVGYFPAPADDLENSIHSWYSALDLQPE